jgi:hypothetical protein
MGRLPSRALPALVYRSAAVNGGHNGQTQGELAVPLANLPRLVHFGHEPSRRPGFRPARIDAGDAPGDAQIAVGSDDPFARPDRLPADGPVIGDSQHPRGHFLCVSADLFGGG